MSVVRLTDRLFRMLLWSVRGCPQKFAQPVLVALAGIPRLSLASARPA